MKETQKNRLNLSFWIFILFAILLVVFSVQNSQAIPVQLIFWNVNASLAILLIGTFLTGLVTGALYAYSKFKPAKIKKEDAASNKEDKSTSKLDNEDI